MSIDSDILERKKHQECILLLRKAEDYGLPLASSLAQHIVYGNRGHGDFLHSVLCNDLCMAAVHADHHNKEVLANYALFLVHQAPTPCYGSSEKVKAWEGMTFD